MKRFLSFATIILAAVLSSSTCSDGTDPGADDREQPAISSKAKGADISWVTEMEDKGFGFYDTDGRKMECTALMKSLGMNAIRLRVWVNPKDGYCSKEDVLVKALRVKDLGMDLLIDFHYSDWWADPGKQNVPAAWEGLSPDEMATAVHNHTVDVLTALKDKGVPVKWVQVGNEVENGMLWESGRVHDQVADNFVKYFNAGRSAVKQVYPDAGVVLHISNAWDWNTLSWFYQLMTDKGASYDIIGLSLYPSYYQNGNYPDWQDKTHKAVSILTLLHSTFSKPVMMVEFGMPASLPEKSRDCLQYLLDGTAKYDWYLGTFLWEPESEHNRNGYDYGAFAGGKPTVALEPFLND